MGLKDNDDYIIVEEYRDNNKFTLDCILFNILQELQNINKNLEI